MLDGNFLGDFVHSSVPEFHASAPQPDAPLDELSFRENDQDFVPVTDIGHDPMSIQQRCDRHLLLTPDLFQYNISR